MWSAGRPPLAKGGAWVQGHWNNAWTIDGVKLLMIDPGKKVIALDPCRNHPERTREQVCGRSGQLCRTVVGAQPA